MKLTQINKKIDAIRDRFLLLEFCNIEEWNCQDLLKLQEKYGIIFTKAGRKRGYDKCQIALYDADRRWFYLVDNEEARNNQAELSREIVVLPSDPKFKLLFDYLQRSQNLFRGFLDKCEKGNLDITFLNDLIERFSRHMVFRLEAGETENGHKNEWNPYLRPDTKRFPYLEFYIIWEILKYVFDRESLIFSRVRKCKFCNSYFLFHRKDQKYCTGTCSSNFRGREWKSKNRERYNKYMRDKRPHGYFWGEK